MSEKKEFFTSRWGMILSVPIMSLIKITCENVEQLRPIAVLLGSGPPRERKRKRRTADPD